MHNPSDYKTTYRSLYPVKVICDCPWIQSPLWRPLALKNVRYSANNQQKLYPLTLQYVQAINPSMLAPDIQASQLCLSFSLLFFLTVSKMNSPRYEGISIFEKYSKGSIIWFTNITSWTCIFVLSYGGKPSLTRKTDVNLLVNRRKKSDTLVFRWLNGGDHGKEKSLHVSRAPPPSYLTFVPSKGTHCQDVHIT